MREKIEEITDPDPQLILGEQRRFPVVIVFGLEHTPDRVQRRIKHRLERPVLPWLCIATCEDIDAVPREISSMFLKARALKAGGRPPTKAKKRT
jgi:hypothetical protein